MPSHKMMSFCFLLGRDGGRNSLTMSFLNRVLNIFRHYLLGTPRVNLESFTLALERPEL